MKQISRNVKIKQFLLLGAMLEVDNLREGLNYNFIENKVNVPQVETVECVKDYIIAMSYHSRGFRLSFWGTNYTNDLKYKRFFFSRSCPKVKPTRYPVKVFLTPLMTYG